MMPAKESPKPDRSATARVRQSQSCDACRARKVRCIKEGFQGSKQPCRHCLTFNIPCKYEYQPKKRGPPNLYLRKLQQAQMAAPGVSVAADAFSELPVQSLHPQIPYTSTAFMSSSTFGASTGLHLQMHTPPPLPAPSQYCGPYRLEDILPLDMLNLIITLFFDFVYPLTPCIHKPSFMVDLAAGREERDPLFFSLVMSTIASTLVQVPRSYVPMERSTVSELARKCYEASRFVTVATYDPPSSMYVVIRYFDSLYHCHAGNVTTQHAAFGEALQIAVTLRMHDEMSYEGLDLIESQVRRRAFWLLFCADKSTSILLGRPVCLRDEDSTVQFPKEIDDECITESDYYPQPQDKVAIVCGLNYSCRLFVLLGETIARLHVDKRSPPHGPFATVRLEEVRSLHARVMDALVHAPEVFQLKRPMALGVMVDRGQEIRMDGTRFRQITLDEIKNSFDDSKSPNALDPFLIMQANLYVTRQLVRFVVERYRDELVTLIQGNVDEYQVAADRETIASDLLNILQSLPIQSIAMNGPSLVHKVRFVASTLLDSMRKADPTPARAARVQAYLWNFSSILSEIEKCYTLDDPSQQGNALENGIMV